MSEHAQNDDQTGDESGSAPQPDSSGARRAWGATGITFFMVGVVFSLTMPDNIALGITFLALGVVFFSLAGRPKGGVL